MALGQSCLGISKEPISGIPRIYEAAPDSPRWAKVRPGWARVRQDQPAFGRVPGTCTSRAPQTMLLIDPRLGDVEDDASSTKRRSLLAIAGTLLSEISIPKLVTSWLLLIALPAILLGLFPDRKSTRLNSSHLGISYAVF